MINFEQFEKIMKTIEYYVDKDYQLMKLVGDGVCTYSNDIIQVLTDTLKIFFDGDGEEWIEWWIWECGFGKNHCNYREKDGDEDISLSDIKVFYNFMMECYKKRG